MELVISPGAPTPLPAMKPENYSYALLGLLGTDGQAAEWKETLNSAAVVASDRGIGTGPADVTSVWHDYQGRYRHGWYGAIAWNDGSVSLRNFGRGC